MVPDPIYAEVIAEDQGLNVQVRNCWATNCEHESYEPGCLQYQFIDTYQVPVENTMIKQNCNAPAASFWINSFTFNNGKNKNRVNENSLFEF